MTNEELRELISTLEGDQVGVAIDAIRERVRQLIAELDTAAA